MLGTREYKTVLFIDYETQYASPNLNYGRLTVLEVGN